jgi:putative ABC transport system substrate-binding protein
MQLAQLKRRDFIMLLGGAAAMWPLAARAQQQAMPLVGSLTGHSRTSFAAYLNAFQRGLAEMGFIESRNVAIEYRFAEGQYDRMPEMATDLMSRSVTVMLLSGGGAQAVLISKIVTTIPVVFVTGSDPVRAGIVQSLNRPGANVTGVYQFAAAMDAKRLGMLHEIVPNARNIAVLVNPAYVGFETQLKEVEQAAKTLGLGAQFLRASTEGEINVAFAAIAEVRAGALLVCADPFFNSRRTQIVALAARHAIPAIYEQREFVESGGLLSYGASIRQAYMQAGSYTGRILKGERAADLPVAQTTKFELVINLVVAKAFRLDIPPHVLALADEVIE